MSIHTSVYMRLQAGAVFIGSLERQQCNRTLVRESFTSMEKIILSIVLILMIKQVGGSRVIPSGDWLKSIRFIAS